MSYSTGPYAQFTSLPAPPRPEVHSSRKVSFAHKIYETNPVTGGFDGMPSMAQTVVMLVSYAVEPAKFITPNQNQKTKDDIVTALKPLTDAEPPMIVIRSVEIGQEGPGVGYRRIVFTDLLKGTGIDQTVQLP